MAKKNDSGSLIIAFLTFLIAGIVFLIGLIVKFFKWLFTRKKNKKVEKETPQYEQTTYAEPTPAPQPKQINPEIEKEKTITFGNLKLFSEKTETLSPTELIKEFGNSIIVLDTETTGLYFDDELLQLSIVNCNGDILFNKYLKPKNKKSWKEAEKINKISPAMVKDKQTLDFYKNELQEILKNKIVVGYNIAFDYKYLVKENLILDNYITADVMKAFSAEYGEWNSYYGNCKFQKLETCAKHYGYTWQGNAHNALADTLATLHCFKQLKEINITTWNKIDLEEEKKKVLCKKFNCKDFIKTTISNTKKSKWIDDLKPNTVYKNINFKLGKTKEGSAAKPPIAMYSGEQLLGYYSAGTNIYNATKNLNNNKNYELFIESKNENIYEDKICYYFKVYILEK